MKVAICGLGNMGRAFATRALDRGHEVTVWNRSPGNAADLVEAGAHEARSPAEAAKAADVVLVIVSDDTSATEVCGQVVDAMNDTAILCNISTVSPAAAMAIAEAGPDQRVLDTPVLGSPTAVKDGNGRFLIGGPATAYDVVKPLLLDLAAEAVHCGSNGAGATMKLASNLLLISGVTALAEAIEIARGQGVDDGQIKAAFDGSLVISRAQAVRMSALFNPAHPGWFGPKLALKDVRLAIDMAHATGVDSQIASATANLLDDVVDSDYEDFAAVIEAVRPTA